MYCIETIVFISWPTMNIWVIFIFYLLLFDERWFHIYLTGKYWFLATLLVNNLLGHHLKIVGNMTSLTSKTAQSCRVHFVREIIETLNTIAQHCSGEFMSEPLGLNYIRQVVLVPWNYLSLHINDTQILLLELKKRKENDCSHLYINRYWMYV